MFIKYPHLEKFGNAAVADIEFGVTHIFPKLDGTNASVWLEDDGTLAFGSRNRQLTLDKDNAGFMFDMRGNEQVLSLLNDRPSLVLYGEWLVPHTVKHYRQEMWRKFYVFDVYDKEQEKFLEYDAYQPLLEQHKLTYIPCIKKIKNGSWENFLAEAKACRFGLPDEDPRPGEGIVIKNYNWVNRFNGVTWAKIVNGEFKDDFHAKMGAPTHENKSAAATIADKACTESLIDKEYAKIVADVGEWGRKYIPRLLHTVYYSVVTEELWDCLKHINKASVNFQELQKLCEQKVKEHRKDIF